MYRREFIAGMSACALSTGASSAQILFPGQADRNPDWPPPDPPPPQREGSRLDLVWERIPPLLDIHVQDTGESFEGLFYRMAERRFIRSVLVHLNWLLRDWREGLPATMDTRLLWACAGLSARLRDDGKPTRLVMLSGYRTDRTNRKLPKFAADSLHMKGMALDLAAPAWSSRQLYNQVHSLEVGGTGWYPENRFVHMDTGLPRVWTG